MIEGKTEREKIIEVMMNRKWFSTRAIWSALDYTWKTHPHKIQSVNRHLLTLICSGHIQRALHPKPGESSWGRPKYIYRYTGKAYTANIMSKKNNDSSRLIQLRFMRDLFMRCNRWPEMYRKMLL